MLGREKLNMDVRKYELNGIRKPCQETRRNMGVLCACRACARTCVGVFCVFS